MMPATEEENGAVTPNELDDGCEFLATQLWTCTY